MDMQLAELLTVGGLAVVLTIVVQLAKAYIAERYVPLFAVGGGVAIAILAAAALGRYGVENVAQAILTGLLAGAGAIGLYQLAPRRLLPPKE